MTFDGFELLEFAVKSIRGQIDHISVTYQTTSYFGNQAEIELLPTLEKLKSEGFIDELIFYEPDLKLPPKENELRLRNIGLEASRKAGCSHHISADVDEFYDANQLNYVKKVMEDGGYNYSVARTIAYYKDPTYLVWPEQDLLVTLIHSVDNEYNKDMKYPDFPFHMETTRKLLKTDRFKVLSREEFVIHHMSYVRRDIRRKFDNSDNGRFYNIDKFVKQINNYKLGERVCLLPDYLNRRTRLVENKFGIII